MRTSKALVLSLLVACASAQAAEPAVGGAAPGEPPIRKFQGHLVDAKGRGIYTWDGDKTLGVSSCTTQCRLLWPPITAGQGAQPKGPFTLATRPDGTQQWALRGRPLYRWASDTKYGDAGGDGVAGLWHLVKVAPPKAAGDTPASDKSGSDKPGSDKPAPGKSALGKSAAIKSVPGESAAIKPTDA